MHELRGVTVDVLVGSTRRLGGELTQLVDTNVHVLALGVAVDGVEVLCQVNS